MITPGCPISIIADSEAGETASGAKMAQPLNTMPLKGNTIIHVIDSLGLGGAEVLLGNTLRLLPEYEHVLITLTPPPQEQLSALQHCLKAHDCLQVYTPKQWPRGIFTLRSIIKKHMPLLVHAHSQTTGLLTKMACPRPIPLFYTIHNPYSVDAFAPNRLALPAERLTARRYHHLIGVSALALDDYRQHVPHSGTGDVVHNMVGAEFFEAKAPERYIAGSPLHCVSVGNLKNQKNYFYSLKAFKLLRHLPVTLDIYGGGPQQELMEAYIRSNNLDNVTLKGKSGDIAGRLPGYHLYIISSSYEGFGIAPLEAMAAGLPVFASDIPVFKEVAGSAVHYFDLTNPASLSDALTDTYEGRITLSGLSEQGRRQAMKIAHPEVYKKRLLSVYKQYL